MNNPLSRYVAKEDKLYYLKCGDSENFFKFRLETLLRYPATHLTLLLLEAGAGQKNAVHLDYDYALMKKIVRELKFPHSVDWRLSFEDLNLAYQYAKQMNLYEVGEMINDTIKERESLQTNINDFAGNIVEKVADKLELSSEMKNKTFDFLFSLMNWKNPSNHMDLFSDGFSSSYSGSEREGNNDKGDDEEEEFCDKPGCNCGKKKKPIHANVKNNRNEKDRKDQKNGQDIKDDLNIDKNHDEVAESKDEKEFKQDKPSLNVDTSTPKKTRQGKKKAKKR